MTPKVKEVLARCIDDGAQHGYSKAYDLSDDPTEEDILDAIVESIWIEVNTYFNFEGAPLTRIVEDIIDDHC